MTKPVPVFERSTIAGARRTERGTFWLMPTREVRNAIVYLFIHYAKKYEVRLLTLVIMSNHLHWVLDDPHGNYPQFLSALYSRITEVLNHHYGRSGPMWQNTTPQRTRLLDDETIEAKLLYAAANATWHGIEFRSRLWDGFVFSPEDVGETIEVGCPQYLLDKYKSFPETHSYVVPKPWAYADRTNAQVRRHFRKKRLARELAIKCERKGKPFLTSARALEMSPDHVPDPKDDPRDLQKLTFEGATEEATRAGFRELDTFRALYRAAREKFLAGDRHVEWPRGTWAMRAWHLCPTCLT